MTYRNFNNTETPFETLVGKTITAIENRGEELLFATSDGKLYRQIYYDDCCASCSVEEIHGDLEDLIGNPVLHAEEACSRDPEPAVAAERAEAKAKAEANKEYYYGGESETWTFYKISTIKGSVTIRWYGSSNGYYSETPTFELVNNSEEKND